jgi:hypothetical protein
MKTSYFQGKDGFVWWNGVVEDRKDPLFLGRCKVRILGWHTEDKSMLPTADLPWAQAIMPITSASQTGVGEAPVGPVEGTWVMGFYRDGELAQEPVMMGTMHGIPSDFAKQNIGFNDPRLDTDDSIPYRVLSTGAVASGGGGNSLQGYPYIPKSVKRVSGEEPTVTNYTDEEKQELDGQSLYPRKRNQPTTSVYARGIQDTSSKVAHNSIVSLKTNLLNGLNVKLNSKFEASDSIIKTSGEIVTKGAPYNRYIIPEEYAVDESESIDFPTNSYSAIYPFNHVYESESGHLIEIDDTPNSERLHWFHRVGTFTEFTPVGSRIDVTYGHNYRSINGNLEEIISGRQKRNVSNDSFSKYGKNKFEDIANDYVLTAKGDLLLGSEAGFATIKGKDVVFDTKNTLYMNSNTVVRSAKLARDNFKGTYYIDALGGYEMRSDTFSLNASIGSGKIITGTSLTTLVGGVSEEIIQNPIPLTFINPNSKVIRATFGKIVLETLDAILTGGIDLNVGPMGAAGKIAIKAPLGDIDIKSNSGPQGINIQATTFAKLKGLVQSVVEGTLVNIKADALLEMDGALITLGGKTEPMILGKTFLMDLFKDHQHPSSVGPTGPIMPQYAAKIIKAMSKKCFLG